MSSESQAVSAAINCDTESSYRYAVSYWTDATGFILLFGPEKEVLSRVDCCEYSYEKPLALAFHCNLLYATIYGRTFRYIALESEDESFDLAKPDASSQGESEYTLFKERCAGKTMKLVFFELSGDLIPFYTVKLNTVGQPADLVVTEDGTVLIQITPCTDDNVREISFYKPP